MTRKEFLKIAGILGVSLPFSSMMSSCRDRNMDFSGTTLIIGAGAAGMSAGYLLAQQGLEFRILEASSTYGGRIKQSTDFVDFPIPLGGEWLHVDASELDAIVNNSGVQITTVTQPYNSQDPTASYENGQLTYGTIGNFGDRKFIGTT